MFRRLGVAVAIIGFAMSASPASAISVPINAPPIAPALGSLQGAVGNLANGAEQIVTSIETAVGSILAEITDRLAGVEPSGKTLSYTASAAAAVASNPAAAGAADEQITPTSPAPAPLPPSPTTTQVIIEKEQPVIEAVPTDDTVTQGELADLLSGLKSALSLIAAQRNATPTNVESQIAALRSAISSQGYSAVASPPLGGGAPNTIAAASDIGQLFGTNITNPSITGGSIAGASLSGGSVSADSLSVSGDTSLSGDLNVGGNFTAGSISFGAASSSNSITTNATSTNLFATTASTTYLSAQTASLGSLTLGSALPVSSGGTGISNPSAAGILLGSYAGGGWQQLATSSLGLLTTNVAEGTNLYFTNARADARINATSSIGTLLSAPNLTTVGTLSGPVATSVGIG
jgi:hypothetical protein